MMIESTPCIKMVAIVESFRFKRTVRSCSAEERDIFRNTSVLKTDSMLSVSGFSFGWMLSSGQPVNSREIIRMRGEGVRME